MKPVRQTIFGKPDGNCFQACVASLLEVPLEEVPSFTEKWWLELEAWLESRGLAPLLLTWPLAKGSYFCLDTHYIACGLAGRGLRHSVIYKNQELIHDPHPDNTGLVEEPDTVILFVRKG